MSYVIEKNKFAPKCSEYADRSVENSHGIIYRGCNFRCAYCELRNRPDSDFSAYDAIQFNAAIHALLPDGKNFKFSGGEPCVNPNLLRDLRIVRQYGGRIYLDTNGSRPDVLRSVLDENLADVIGLSLKGFTREEAAETAGVLNKTLAWDNVLHSIALAVAAGPDIRTIITAVVTSQTNLDAFFQAFAEMVPDRPNVFLKVNNLMENVETAQRGFFAVEAEMLREALLRFLDANSRYAGRIILITSDKAVGDYSSIAFY